MNKLMVKVLAVSCFLTLPFPLFFDDSMAADLEQRKVPSTVAVAASVIHLVSGESKYLSLASDQNSSTKQAIDEPEIECEYAWGNDEVVQILPGCKVIAQHLGRVGLLVREIKPSAESQLSRELEIRVKPKNIGHYTAGESLLLKMESHLHQQWFLLNGFEEGKIYRADFAGELARGTRLRIITDNGRAGNSCGNTIPEALTQTTCYFGANRDTVLLAIDQAASKPFKAGIAFLPVTDSLILANFTNADSTATSLAIGEPVSGFVLANQISSNSKHFFHFPVDQENHARIQVRLFDFSEGIQLNVMWIDGYCNHDMIKKTPSQILCYLPTTFMGDLTIVVDGNNSGSELSNGSVVKSGGSFYRLVVEFVP